MYSDMKKKIGLNLRDFRLARGLRQHELAEMVGVEDKTISRIEVGGNYPSIALLVKLAEALECTLVDLVKTDSADNGVKKSIKELNEAEIEAVKKFCTILSENI